MKFPEVFITGELKTTDKRLAYADALQGWAICSSGSSVEFPDNFGIGMVLIGELLGHTVIPTTIMDYAYKYEKKIDRIYITK